MAESSEGEYAKMIIRIDDEFTPHDGPICLSRDIIGRKAKWRARGPIRKGALFKAMLRQMIIYDWQWFENTWSYWS